MVTTEATTERAARNWGWILAYGVLLIIVGIFALVNPLATGLAVGVLLGSCFLVGGIISLGAAFQNVGWRSKLVDIVFGLLALVAGFICLVDPFGGAVSLVWVIGVFFLVNGGFEFVEGMRTGHEKIWLTLLGVCDMLIGFWATFFMGPGAALLALAMLVGIGFLFRGTLLSALAFQVRSRAKG